MEPPLIPLIKSKNYTKSEKDSIQIKFHRYPTLETFDMHESKTGFFDNGKQEELLLFMWNFQMMLYVSGTLVESMNIQYLRIVLFGEALRQCETLCAKFISTTMEHLN